MQAGFFLLFHSCCILPCWCQLWVVNWISKVSATSIGTLMCIHHKHSMAIWIKSMNSNRIPGGEPSGQQFFRLAVANTSKLHMIRIAADGYSSTPGMPCVTWTEIARLRGMAFLLTLVLLMAARHVRNLRGELEPVRKWLSWDPENFEARETTHVGLKS